MTHRYTLWMRPLTIGLALLLAGCSGVEPSKPAPVPAPVPVAGTPAPTKVIPSLAGFQPSRHGFAFVNSFSGSPLPIDLGTKSTKLPSSFGLCGGMSFAAADYFLAHKESPPNTRPPAQGTALYTYLYKRQATSIGPMGAMGLKFIQWMRLPTSGAGSTHELTLQELPGIAAALTRREPVVIGLVLVTAAETPEPWHNHQVLAYGVDESVAGRTDIRIYDPNFPKRDDVVIRITREGEDCLIESIVPNRRTSRVWGLFRMSYVPVVPP